MISNERQIASMLRNAMERSQRLDGSKGVIDGLAGHCELTTIQAPVLLSSAELEDDWTEHESGGSERASLERFELLSLAARLALSAKACEADGGDAHEEAALAREIGVNLSGFPVIQAATLVETLAWAAHTLQEEPLSPQASEAQPYTAQALRGGLNLSGFRIVGDIAIYNSVLPFPVRLIGCVIEGYLVADHCQMASLDLSGSAIHGVSANFMRMQGSLRLRRTCCIGPLDMGAAEIGGVVDMSDAIVCPLVPPPPGTAFVGDRGAVNFSLATVENEFRAVRARIYGGLAMKGAIVRRSMFMERALICSPIATVVKMGMDTIGRQKTPLGDRTTLKELRYAFRSDGEIARSCFPRKRQSTGLRGGAAPGEGQAPNEGPASVKLREAALRKAEVRGAPHFTGSSARLGLLYRLLSESMRARTTAVRADGLRVDGSLFARGVVSMGRFRIKYGQLQGGLHLEGSRLRSPGESFGALTELRSLNDSTINGFCDLADRSRDRALAHEKGEGEGYALDLRETTIRGSLSLNPSSRPSQASVVVSDVCGAIVASQASIESGLHLRGVRFQQSRHDNREQRNSLDIEHTKIGCNLDLSLARGVVGVAASYAEIAGSLFLWEPPGDTLAGSQPEVKLMANPAEAAGRISLRSATIAGDAWLLFDQYAGPHLELRQAKILGALNIFPADPSLAKSDAPRRLVRKDRVLDNAILTHDEFRTRMTLAEQVRDSPWQYRNDLPTIDLRSAKTTVIRHPPSAWPRQGGLLITGFDYEISGTVGPLGALAGGVTLFDPDPRAVARRDRNQARIKLGLWLMADCVPLTVVGVALFDQLGHKGPLLTLLDNVGLVNLTLLAALALACFVSYLASTKVQPTSRDSKPMAAFWLRLQPHRPNPFRTPAGYTPTDPYLRAAKALRADGKLRSADRVELARARERRSLMSLRHNMLSKVALRGVDLIASYGFNLARTLVISLFLVFAIAGVLEWGHHRYEALNPDAPKVLFNSQIMATEVILPLIHTGISSKWLDEEPKADSKTPSADAPVKASPADGEWQALRSELNIFVWLMKIAGFVLSGVIVTGLAARAESFLSRIQN